MERTTKVGGRLITALFIFAVSLFCTILTGVGALVIWLAARIGSLVTAAVVVCLFFAVLTTVSYLLTVRETIARFRDELETVYEMADHFRTGYRWLRRQIGWLFGLKEER
ncbi:MAG: hypothetical protein IIV28_02780 [Alistipes sp.]|nr:hypothetical protein [Alistipes sp.]